MREGNLYNMCIYLFLPQNTQNDAFKSHQRAFSNPIWHDWNKMNADAHMLVSSVNMWLLNLK